MNEEFYSLEEVLEGIDTFLTERESKEEKKQRKFLNAQKIREYLKHKDDDEVDELVDKKAAENGANVAAAKATDPNRSSLNRFKNAIKAGKRYFDAGYDAVKENQKKFYDNFDANAKEQKYPLSNAVKRPRGRSKVATESVNEMKLRIYEAFEEGVITAEDKYLMLECLNPENFGDEEPVQESFLEFMNRE